MELKLVSKEAGSLLLMATSGRITQDSVSSSQDAFVQAGGDGVYACHILLNLQDSEYMDSSGVSWLLQCHKRCRNAGGSLVIHSIPPMIQQILKVLRMNLVLKLADTEQDARKLVQGEFHE